MAKNYLASSAVVVGDVTLGENVSIWHGAVLRGDSGAICVGDNSNVQDNCVLHEKVTIGKGVSVGHGAILHGCTVGDNCVIGAGSVVVKDIPSNTFAAGNPCRVIRPITEEDRWSNHPEYFAD